MNQQQAHADNDRRALRSWHEWEFKDGERRTILCVETALEMRSGEPGFDADQLSLLISEAMEMMRASPSPIDKVRIVPSINQPPGPINVTESADPTGGLTLTCMTTMGGNEVQSRPGSSRSSFGTTRPHLASIRPRLDF